MIPWLRWQLPTSCLAWRAPTSWFSTCALMGSPSFSLAQADLKNLPKGDPNRSPGAGSYWPRTKWPRISPDLLRAMPRSGGGA